MFNYFGTYTTHDENGNPVEVYSADECLHAIQMRIKSYERLIPALRKENEQLKAENYKDQELALMQQKYEAICESMKRGFQIDKDEENAINYWKNKHSLEKHKMEFTGKRIRYSNHSYTYEFFPSELGVFGTIKCSCGDSFEFQSVK